MSHSTKPERPSSSSPAQSKASPEIANSETPMIVVWIALGGIVIAGLYGVYLGTHAGSTDQAEPQKVSQQLVSTPLNQPQVLVRRSA